MFEIFLIVIGTVLIVAPFILSRKYSVLSLIKNQANNFVDVETKRILWVEILGYFIGPLLLTIGFGVSGIKISESGLGILLNIISITTGLLISSLIGINSSNKNEETDELVMITSKYIIFSIFITIILFIISLSKIFDIEFLKKILWINFFYEVKDDIIFYFFIIYILNIFLILKKLIQIYIKDK